MIRVWILLLLWPAVAGAIILPSPDESERTIGGDVELLVDAEGSWRISDVSGRFAGRFMPSSQPMPNFGFSGVAIWFRFTVDFSRVKQQSWYLLQGYPLIDQLTLYESLPAGGFTRVTVGDTLPFADRPIAHRAFVFPLHSQSGDVRTYYLRASGKGALSFELSLLNAQGLIEHVYREQLLFGLFFGGLAALLIYNLLLYFSLRDVSYLYFVVFLAMLGLALLSMNGFGLQYLWPRWPLVNSSYLPFSYLGIAALVGYSRRFLDLPQRMPRMALACLWLIRLHLLLAMLTVLIAPPWSFYLNILMVLMTVALLVVIALLSWSGGYRVARLYLLAWSIFLVALTIFALDSLGVIAHANINNYAPHAGGAWVAMLLSLALADRIRLIERDRRAQSQAVQHALHQQVAATEQVDREKRAFIDYLSHELNTPLNWLGKASLADGDTHPRELADALNLVRHGQQRLQQLVHTSLRYFDLSGRSRPLSLARCRPAALFDGLCDTFTEQLEHKQLQIANRLPSALSVLANEQALSEVLAALLDNAIRLSPRGGLIEFSGRCEGERANLCLSDQGCGLDAEQCEAIFRPFSAVGSSHRTDGFGLSLATARLLIAQMGGSIQAHSGGIDQGALFSIRLPLAK